MSTVRRKSSLKPRPPITWPDWTENFRWELGPGPDDAGPYDPPSDADRRWVAEYLIDEADVIPDDATLEELAEMHSAMARMERGLKD